MNNQTVTTIPSAVAVAIYCAISPTHGNGREKAAAVRLNVAAFEYAKELIKEGHVIADGKGAWGEHQPSAEQENEFIRGHGFGEYAEWHLGIDDRYAENTKRRYKFPYGDFKNVHRSGLLAVRSRARQYGYSDIENAAAELTEMISARKNADKKPSSGILPKPKKTRTHGSGGRRVCV